MKYRAGDILLVDLDANGAGSWSVCKIYQVSASEVMLAFADGLKHTVSAATFAAYPKRPLDKVLTLPGSIESFDAIPATITAVDCARTKVAEWFDVEGNQLGTMRGCPKSAAQLKYRNRGLDRLECEYAVTESLDISDNPLLTSLMGGPKVATRVWASNCGLASLKTNMRIEHLSVNRNPLKNLADCPQVKTLTLDTLWRCEKVLRLSGRCTSLYTTNTRQELTVPTVFRFKHLLRQQGLSTEATL